MDTLVDEQLIELAAYLYEVWGPLRNFEEFSQEAMQTLEDIPGLETVSPEVATSIVNRLWEFYILKNPTSNATSLTPKEVEAVTANSVDLSKPSIKKAIDEGKSLIKDGKTKADAARAMYTQISSESKETIIAAFVEGATLTPKGAQTYWYNCKRRASKEKKAS